MQSDVADFAISKARFRAVATGLVVRNADIPHRLRELTTLLGGCARGDTVAEIQVADFARSYAIAVATATGRRARHTVVGAWTTLLGRGIAARDAVVQRLVANFAI